ncbi:MAG: diguanylate cyclase (GGDEF)-like protein [Alteromonadaceae bacterium]
MKKSLALLLLTFFVIAVLMPVKAAQTDFTQQPLTIAINKTSYPYHFVNEQGQPAGLMVDLWRLWAKQQKVNIEFVADTWQQTLKRVSESDIDIHAGLSKTTARAARFNLSSSFFFHDRYIFIERSFSDIDSLAQLTPYTLGVIKGSSHIDTLNKLAPTLKLRVYDNRHQLYQAALAGDVVAFAGLEKLSKYFPEYKALNNRYPPYKRIHYYRGEYVTAVAKGNDQLLDFIEQGWLKVSQQQRSMIETKWLGFDKQSDTLLLAFTPDLPPYMSVSPTGEAQGLFIDIWRLWAEQSGKEIEFIAQSMSTGIERVKKREIDIHIAYPESKATSTGLLVAREVYGINSAIYVARRLSNILNVSELSGKAVGVFKTAPYKNEIAHTYPAINLSYYNGYKEVFSAIAKGEIDAFVSSIENMNAKLVKNNLQSSFHRLPTPNFRANIYALVHAENTALAAIIQEGFEQLPLDKLVALENSWLNDKSASYFQYIENKVDLNNKELAWKLEQPEIRLGILEQWQPIEFIDSKGQFSGINNDILDIIKQRTDLTFTIIPFKSWHSLLQALLDNKIDILANATPTPERREKVLFSHSYWDLPWVVLHPRNVGEQLNLENFYGKQIAIVKGYHLVTKFQQQHPNISLVLVDNIEEGMLALQSGVVDGFIENLATATTLLKRESLLPLMISVVEKVNVDKNHYAIRKDWPMLKSIIDKGLATISAPEKQTIYEKWFEVNIETGLNQNMVLRVSAQIGIILFIIITIIIVWNRRLHKEIKTRKRLEEKMKHMATHDELTGLANRVLLKDRLNTAINFHQRQSLKIAILFIDLDGFKNINDTYGHDVGDELLIQVAARLSTCVRQSDTVVRFGGDEFVLLLMGLQKNNEASFVAEKALAMMRQPYQLSTVSVCIGCSIGISMYPDDGITDTELLKIADTLMYRVKANGKNHYVFNSTTQNYIHI